MNEFERPTVVAQVSNLPYRRFPIGRVWDFRRALQVDPAQAGSTAIQQIGNLRYEGVKPQG